jgi:Domain of unknown function (DUF929)
MGRRTPTGIQSGNDQHSRRRATGRKQQNVIERYRGALLAILALIIVGAGAVILVIKFGPSSQGKEAAAGAAPVDPGVLAAVTQIPAATFDAVGAGSAGNPPKATGGPPTQTAKPQILYDGAEFCPYCAAERWAMIAALSRFGTFSNLHTVRSSATDVFPNTPTFTFYGSTYDSPYLTFTPVEEYTNQPSGSGYTALQHPTSDQQSMINKYDKAPYTEGGIPFVDFNGQYVFSGATYGPGVLTGMDWQQVSTALTNPSSPQAQGIIGSANLISAAICQTTGQQPADVCGSTGVQKAASLLGK